ncbi:hypothetical protein SCHPADRAFT_319946 [Schizopora paradoxa]|uniref:Uncharacterized protein n=1 Tax=Schizopora paradoxa TaxID=27342 RepID=A0A0H2SBS6_9AGAM|nr:hypothetical protein SCHPADRAFT_319946 [Schizopora paradoxa]
MLFRLYTRLRPHPPSRASPSVDQAPVRRANDFGPLSFFPDSEMQAMDEKNEVEVETPTSEIDVLHFPQQPATAAALGRRRSIYRRVLDPVKILVAARIRMVVLLVAGAAMMVVHDRFYTFLDGRPVADSTQSPFVSILHASLSDQSIANAIGNLIANVSRALFGGAIGVAFVQVFWSHIRRKGLKIGQMDTAMICKEHPFDPTTWRAVVDTFWLALMAFLAALMAIVTIVTPGSLSVASIPVNNSCTVPVANLSDASLSGYTTLVGNNLEIQGFAYRNPNARASRFVTQVLMAGSYIPPPSPCGFCEYNVSFVAPAMNCTNITDQATTEFPVALPIPDAASVQGENGTIIVWNTDYGLRGGNGLGLEIFTRTLKPIGALTNSSKLQVGDNQEAVQCLIYSATYNVFVQHNLSSTITVLDVEMGELIVLVETHTPQETEPMALADATFLMLNGTVTYDVESFMFTSDSNVVANSPLGGFDSDIAWDWQAGGSTDMMFALPSLMQNISLSLLSGADGDAVFTGLGNVDTVCSFTGLHYVYDRNRLLITYGVALLVTSCCVAFGFRAYLQSGIDESFGFSRLLGSILNEDLYRHRGSLDKTTRIMIGERGAYGHLKPVQVGRTPMQGP